MGMGLMHNLNNAIGEEDRQVCLQLKMNQQQQVGSHSFPEGFSLPALELPSKNYSLQADIATGWQPKMRVVGPVPLNFDARVVDEVVEGVGRERLVYLGWRYASSFKLQQEIKRNYPYKYESLISNSFPHLAAYFRKFYNHFKPKHTRPFQGMNPALTLQPHPVFDSNFESGNLDAVVKAGPAEYDLFMRVDSNTRGHVQWYNFTVHPNGTKAIKINIVNFRKYRTLYSQSLRPYVLSQANPKAGWRQGCNNVKYDQKVLRYQFLREVFPLQALTYNCLSFEYEFEGEEVVQFAYCPPFTYTDNLSMITALHSCNLPDRKILKQEVLGQSLGGLQLQLLTITDPEVENEGKKCVLVCGRIHPGQTCGSYMVKGLLEFLCSEEEEARYLRRQVVFKVVPMVNVDGVVVGNFRTSLCGKDLNRMFTSEQTLLIPEVKAVKGLVGALKGEFKSRLAFFLDFHGHSVRKNVFVYGPEYEIWESNYYRTRMLPKIMAGRTEVFRYYSCLFRISHWKRTTARAVFLKHIPHCYTVEASVGSYYSPQEKADVPFTPPRWQLVGKTILQSMVEYLQMLTPDRKKDARKDTPKTKRLPSIKSKLTGRQSNQAPYEAQGSRLSNFQDIQRELFASKSEGELFLSQKAQAYLQEMREEGGKKEEYSEGGSDSEDASEDLGEKEMSSLHQQIIVSLKEFKEKFYHPSKDEPAFRSRNYLRSSEHIPKKGLEMIASLRKKASDLANPNPNLNPREGQTAQWIKPRTQSIRKPQFRPEVQSFQVYVNKIKLVRKGEEGGGSSKVAYFSPKKRRQLSGLIQD